MYEVATQTQAEITNLAEAQAAEMNEAVVALVENVTKNAPAGSGLTVATVKSVMAVANSAYGSLAKMVKQAANVAGVDVTAAPAPVGKPASKKKTA